MMMRRYGLAGSMVLMVAASTMASVTIPGADGSDGAFNPSGTTFTVNLSEAVTGSWDDPSPTPGKGVYDAEKWVVVFKYSSVNVPSGTTVKFTNHPSRAPVVWLVNGSVTISGTVDLTGATGHANGLVAQSEPGPGGFRGGTGHQGPIPESAGNGPGGARNDIDSSASQAYGASYSALGINGLDGAPGPIYGNERIIPLIGGSGGAGYMNVLGDTGTIQGGAGAGGGAILIAAKDQVTINGTINSAGGATGQVGSGGSGGAIRIICDALAGTSGTLRALGGVGYNVTNGSNGRIRVESNSITLPDPGIPTYTFDLAGATAVLWPEDVAPLLRITYIGNAAVPDDPQARLEFPNQDVTVNSSTSTIEIEALNMPLDWIVTVRAVPRGGDDIETIATLDSGDESLSIWTADITFPNGFSAVQVRAAKP